MAARQTRSTSASKKPAPRAAAKPRTQAAARSKTLNETTSRTRTQVIQQKFATQQSGSLRLTQIGLTAAAEVMTDPEKAKGVAAPNAPTRTWQHSAYGYVKTVPELNAAKMYVGNCLARVALKVGKRNMDGSIEPLPEGWDEIDTDTGLPKAELPEGLSVDIVEAAAKIIATIRTNIGGQSELLRAYGEKMFVAGEMYLLPTDSVAGLTFDVLSTLELSKDGDHWVRLLGPGAATEEVPVGIEPIRVWRPDDVYGRLATSSVRSCLEILEELVVLTRLVRSSAISRMALAGVLAIADEFDDPDDEVGEDGQTAEQTNPLAVDIIMTGAKAIDDPASAAAWLPYILQGPADLIEKGLKYIQFKGDDALNVVKRKEAIERLATGLDLPMEVVLGHQSTTFANAAQISEDTFKLHIEPTITMFTDAATMGILWPALAKQLGVQPESVAEVGYPDEVLSVAISYDADDLISRPDKAKDIVEVFVKDATQSSVRISEVRLALGLTADDWPDDGEIEKRLAAVERSHEKAAVPTLLPMDGAEQTTVAPVGAPPGGGVAPPAEGDAAAAGITASLAVAASLAQRIAGAAEVTMERAAERIGARLRPKLKGSQQSTFASVANVELTRALGPAVVKRLLGDEDPVDAEMAAFSRAVARWAQEAGLRHPGQLAEAVASILAATTTDRLYSAAVPTFDVETFVALAAASPTPSEA